MLILLATIAAVAPAAPGSCAQLGQDYEGASKSLAANMAEALGDNSAPRATLREMRDANTLARAHITLELLRDNHCPLPRSAPDGIFYFSAALQCATDRLKGPQASPPSCDSLNWSRGIK